MNGYEFVGKILGETNNDVGPLLDMDGGVETDWLEFKAATQPEGGIYKDKDNVGDHRWGVAKPLVALANTIGGAVLLGIAETKDKAKPVKSSPVEPVSLECSGFVNGDKDKFTRELREQVLYPKKGWRGHKEGNRLCPEQHELFEPRWGKFRGQDVVIILVKPRKPTDGWLALERSTNGKAPRTVVLSRSRGDVGQTVEIPDGRIDAWWENREVGRTDLDNRWHFFREKWKTKGKHPIADVEDSIRSYLAKLQKDIRSRDAWISGQATANDVGMVIPDLQVEAFAVGVREQPASIKKIFKQGLRAMLLGEPGAGKSTSLRSLALEKAVAWQPGQPWVLLASLSQYNAQGLRALLLEPFPGLCWVDLEPKLASREMVLILDGLNECPSLFYEDCIQEIRGLLSDNRNASILVSSRLTHYPADMKLRAYVIRPMDRGLQSEFLHLHLGDPEQAGELLDRIYRQPGAELIASNPFLLQMTAEIFRDGGVLPESRASLYRQSFEGWHRRESDKAAVPLRWPSSRVRDALARLSFQMRAKGQVSCSRNDARRVLEPEMGNDVGRFLDRVAQGLLLIVEQAQDKDESVRFAHETMQEYLAAEYLVANEDRLSGDLLQDGSGRISSNWTMPFVFAFELIDEPKRDFLQRAWQVEPLLVAAALRDSGRLARLPLHSVDENPWLRGVLRTMRGEEAVPETKELAYVSRLPPKYPLPNNLVAALRTLGFWYAGGAHEAGRARIERLRHLILERNSLWIELLPHAYARNPEWLDDLSPAQRLLVEQPMGCDRSRMLRGITVVELCTLLRFRKIKDNEFLSCWEDALQRGDPSHLDMDLIVLLRTMAKVKPRVDWAEDFVSRLNSDQHERLRQVGGNWKLSCRLLNLLVRLGLISALNIRDEPGRLTDITKRMSDDNAYRFMMNRVIVRDDMSPVQLKDRLAKMKPDYRKKLLARGLITERDIGFASHRKKFSGDDLDSTEKRRTIAAQLLLKEWEVTVKRVDPAGGFAFASHPDFSGDLFFLPDNISDTNSRSVAKGDALLVRLEPRYNKKKERWGFAVKSGKILKKFASRRSDRAIR